MFLKDDISILKRSLKYLFTDKVIISLSMCPLLIGVVLYIYIGNFFYNDLLMKLKSMFDSYLGGNETVSTTLTWVMGILLTIGVYYVVSLTFVLVVGLLASPFNDYLSKRVIKLEGKEKELLLDKEMSMMARTFFILKNEIKKLIFIGSFSIFSFVIGLIPFMAPVSITLNGLLLAANFQDYSWSHRNLRFGLCMKALWSKFLANTIAGLGFMVLFTIPIVNLISLPLAVIFFTIMDTENE